MISYNQEVAFYSYRYLGQVWKKNKKKNDALKKAKNESMHA